MSWHQNPAYDRSVVKLMTRLSGRERDRIFALQLRRESVLKRIAFIDAQIQREKQNS